ncbi:MAG: glycyl-radical enzyme activating protein [Firmicutes bacterium]|nr:glycyl-radical enzyme activating protein [Bacillota bacterium]
MSGDHNFDKSKFGYVFNIQHYSVHDGPGIRTLVFLKGCPLKCQWCSNPESQKNNPELAYNFNKCIGLDQCNRCLKACPNGAIKKSAGNEITIDRQECDSCFKCADACPSHALNVFGNLMSVKEVVDKVEKDSVFYSRSGGGMTLSGGEALVQAEFTTGLLKEAKRRRINTTIETCGYANWESIEKAGQYLDNILYDIKCLDPSKHKEFTGVTNELIIENLKKLRERFPKTAITVRTPVVPGFNDTEEDILAIIKFIKDIQNVKYELLPYHRLGEPKYTYLDREYPFSGFTSVDDERMTLLKKIVQDKFQQ